jgi:hypothetical protein
MPKDLPSSLQQHGRCYRSAFYVRKLQLPSGHTNALAESFNAAVKVERVNRTVYLPANTPERMLPGTSNSVIIVNVFTRHSTTRPRKRSITSTSTGSPQHEIAINQLSGKDKAAHYELGGDVSPRHRVPAAFAELAHAI